MSECARPQVQADGWWEWTEDRGPRRVRHDRGRHSLQGGDCLPKAIIVGISTILHCWKYKCIRYCLLLSSMGRDFRPFPFILRNFTSHRALQQRHQSNTTKSANTFLTVCVCAILSEYLAKSHQVKALKIVVGTRITNSLVHCFPLLPGKVATQF